MTQSDDDRAADATADASEDERTSADGAERVDPDLELVADYLSGAMSPEQLAAFAQRLEQDPEFRTFVDTMDKVWALPVADSGGESLPRRELTAVEDQAHWDRFLKSAPEGGNGGPGQPRGRGWRGLVAMAGAVAVGVIVGGAVLFQGADKAARTFAGPVVPLLEGRATNPGIQDGQMVETGPGETKRVTLPDRSSVLLRPVSRLTYSKNPDRRMAPAALDGEGVFQVAKGSTWFVMTNGGFAFLAEGTYALESAMFSAEMRLSIASGEATVRPDTVAVYRAGDYVLLSRDPPSGRVTRDPTGFPKVDVGSLSASGPGGVR